MAVLARRPLPRLHSHLLPSPPDVVRYGGTHGQRQATEFRHSRHEHGLLQSWVRKLPVVLPRRRLSMAVHRGLRTLLTLTGRPMKRIFVGTIFIALIVAITQTGASQAAQAPGCPPPSGHEGRGPAITRLRLINSLQNDSFQRNKAFASTEAVERMITQAQPPALGPAARLDLAATPTNYVAAVTLSGQCPLALFTTQEGLIFEGTPIR